MIVAMYIFNAGSVEDPPRKRYKQQELGPMLLKATKAELDDAVADFSHGTDVPLQHQQVCFVFSFVCKTCILQPASWFL